MPSSHHTQACPVAAGSALAPQVVNLLILVCVLQFVTPTRLNAQADRQMATLQVVVDNSYQTPASLRQIEQFSTVIPPRTVRVQPGDTLSAIVAREYGFGRSDKQVSAAYEGLLSAIRRLNDGLSSDDTINPGALLIPNLPKWGFAKRQPLASAESKAATPSGRDIQALTRNGTQPVDLISQTTFAIGRADSTLVHVDVLMDTLRSVAGQQLLRENYIGVERAPIDIAFAVSHDQDLGVSQFSLFQVTQSLARRLTSPRRRVNLFVLDSGWPLAEHGHSLGQLREMIDDVGALYGIEAPHGPDVAMPAAKQTHCEQIAEAIAPLQALDRGSAVNVVFIPLTRDQRASEVLTKLVQLGLSIQRLEKLSRAGTAIVSAERRASEVAHAALDAKQITDRLPKDATAMPFTTDGAVLDAVWYLGRALSKKDNSFFVVSESWTAPSGVLSFKPIDLQRGIAITAAGNEKKRIIFQEPVVNFASNALTSDYVVAVVNLDSSGTIACDSSELGTVGLDLVRAVGFDGRIKGHCATSFATPRVAWLIAAADAVRSVDVDPSIWPGRTAKLIRQSRVAGTFLLDPTRLFDLVDNIR